MAQNEKQDEKYTSAGGKQTNLAEGERDVVEESIRNHERKGDLQSPEEEKKRNKDTHAA